MTNLISSVILVSLLLPTGFNFITQKSIDYSYAEITTRERDKTPVRVVNDSFGLETTATSIVVVDDFSGLSLYNKNPASILSIASITKLMTALVILDTQPDWDQLVTIEEQDQRDGGQVYLLTGEQVRVKDLFYLMLVSSSNEAAVAIARNSGIENFISAMNKKAADLAMVDTHFIDSSGLEVENFSTAIDLIKLGRVAFAQQEIVEALTTEQYNFTVANTGRVGIATNTDKLLSSFLNIDGYKIIGAKTGFLDEAGYCLLLQVQKINGPSLTIALLGADTITDRWQETKGLIDWVFRNYNWPE